MNRWNSFLNSLSTAGGNLALLYSLVVFLLVTIIAQVCHHGAPNADISSFAKDGEGWHQVTAAGNGRGQARRYAA